jgi:phosphoribosylamine---glycine ligase
MRVLVVGGGAREHAIAESLKLAGAKIIVASPNANPGLDRIAEAAVRLDPTQPPAVVGAARQHRVDYAVVGPEAALAAGVTDALRTAEVPVAGPSRGAAQIETSKAFCRELLDRHHIEASPRYVALRTTAEVDAAVASFPGPFVVKPVGLTAGKDVWVQGADFQVPAEGAARARQLLDLGKGGVLLEEKLEGEEFSLMVFATDSGVYPMPVVHDYKRALEGDAGGNTGGMGSYSQRDHLLPFLSPASFDRALEVLTQILAALAKDGLPYRGVLYGGFMETAKGPVLVECNARFGDPEGINVLTLYEEGNFDLLMFGVAQGRVDPNLVRFRQRATVVKYVVPPGYGSNPTGGGFIEFDAPAINALGVHLRYGSVEAAGPGRFKMSTSRALALVGEASAIHEAASRVEAALPYLKGAYQLRHDIATKADLTARLEHLRRLRSPGSKASPLPLSVAAADAPPSSAAGPSQVISTGATSG